VSRVIDGRGMLPPEPMERVLAALPTLGVDEELTVLVFCQPIPLFNALREANFVWREEVAEDGTHAVSIRRSVAAP
jgi:hypothetical protein